MQVCCDIYIAVYYEPSTAKKIVIIVVRKSSLKVIFTWNESTLVCFPLVQPDFIFNSRYAMEAEETARISNEIRRGRKREKMVKEVF